MRRSLPVRIGWMGLLILTSLSSVSCAKGSPNEATEVPQAAPTFTIKANPSSVSLTRGFGSQTISISATAQPGFTGGTIAVALKGLPPGMTASPTSFNLNPGTAKTITLTAPSAAVGSGALLLRGVAGTLSQTVSLPLAVKVDFVTQHNDVERTGLNPNEPILNPANVTTATFGLLRTLPVDQQVDAQPLVVSNVTIGGKLHDVVYVVTENDSLYAFDAASGARLWRVSVVGAHETVASDHAGCGQPGPDIGVTSTPVVDRKAGPNGTLFLVAATDDDLANNHQRLHAIDLATGAERPNSPVDIEATYPGNGPNSSGGKLTFEPQQYLERTGLLLLRGHIYLGWASHCDRTPYNGWVMSYDETTLAQSSVINITPNGASGGIWMAGTGLAADSNGFIYFLDGNGTFDTELSPKGFPLQHDFGNGFLKLSTFEGKLSVADYFEMHNTVDESSNDQDLGSGGLIVLPDMKDAKGAVHHLAVGAGKDRNIYVVNRDSMGKFNPNTDSAIEQEVSGEIGGVWSAPAYFNNAIYYAAVKDVLKVFPIVDAKLATAPSEIGGHYFSYPGASLSISADGVKDGIVWAVNFQGATTLYAYDATNLHTLYTSDQAANGRDSLNGVSRFIAPVVVNGMVYIATPKGVAVFGLLSK